MVEVNPASVLVLKIDHWFLAFRAFRIRIYESSRPVVGRSKRCALFGPRIDDASRLYGWKRRAVSIPVVTVDPMTLDPVRVSIRPLPIVPAAIESCHSAALLVVPIVPDSCGVALPSARLPRRPTSWFIAINAPHQHQLLSPRRDLFLDLARRNQVDLPTDLAPHSEKEAASQIACNLVFAYRDLVAGVMLRAAERGVGNTVESVCVSVRRETFPVCRHPDE
jgi:hypothetical protein